MESLYESFNNKDLTNDEMLNLISEFDFDEIVKQEDIDNDICESCDKKDTLRYDQKLGIVVCTQCGQVNDKVIDDSPEWKNYGDDDRNDVGRCSMPINPHLPQASLGTTIPRRCKIQTLHRWSAMPYKERSKYIVLKMIENKCREGNIIKCIEDDAKIIFNNICECKHVKGKNKGKNIIIRGINRLGLIAACVYYACRRNNKPMNPKEIAVLFSIRQKDLTKGRRTLFKLLKIRKMGFDLKASSAEDFIPRMCKQLRIEDKLYKFVIKLAKNIKRLNIASAHTQPSIATACMLLMIQLNDLNITKKLIASKFDVSEVTITKAYRCIEEYTEIIINDDYTERVFISLEEERKKLDIPKSLQDKYNSLHLDEKSDEELDEDDIVDDQDPIDTKLMCDIEYDDVMIYFNNIDLELYSILDRTERKYNSLFID